jgi:ATP-binding cassette, subfamily G (WHITE), member 2, SNQ2
VSKLFLQYLGTVTYGDRCSTFFLFVFTMALVMKAWFRSVAAAFGDPAPAQTVAGIMLLLLVLYTGYAVPKPSMIGALKWISYINVSDCQ